MFITPQTPKLIFNSQPKTNSFSEQMPSIEGHSQPKFKKNIAILTSSKVPKSSPKPYSNSKSKLSFTYKSQYIQNKSFKLPAISELLELNPK